MDKTEATQRGHQGKGCYGVRIKSQCREKGGGRKREER